MPTYTTHTLLEGTARPMNQSARPIFVIGSLRSGASLLTWSLGQHPNIVPLVDSRWLGHFSLNLHESYALGVQHRAQSQLDLMGIEIEDFCEYFGQAVFNLFLEPRNWRGVEGDVGDIKDEAGLAKPAPPVPISPVRPTRWVDGSPDHCFNVFGLLRLFPQARFFHVLRDADEVVGALTDPVKKQIYRSHFRQMTEEAAYEHWLKSVDASVAAERAFGSDTVLRVRRDELVQAPERILKLCLSFLGEPFSPACLRPFR